MSGVSRVDTVCKQRAGVKRERSVFGIRQNIFSTHTLKQSQTQNCHFTARPSLIYIENNIEIIITATIICMYHMSPI